MAEQNLPQNMSIRELYVFNPNFGDDSENEIRKVIYHYPGSVEPDEQLKKVGLCEAIIKFAQTFNTSTPCESLHTQNYRYVFHKPEDGFWMILVLSVPCVTKTSSEGIDVLEYQNEEIQDNVFSSVLSKLYNKFTLLNGSFSEVVERKSLESLNSLIKKYFDVWIPRIYVNQCGLMDIFSGVKFLSLSRNTFLKIQCFLNSFMMTWPQVKYIVVMQRDKLIWSGIGQDHIQTFYEYILNDLLSQHFLRGEDKQSTFGIILKKESHIIIPDSGSSAYGTKDKEDFGMAEEQDVDGRSCVSFMTASTGTINGHAVAKLHMLIYKGEQSYIVLLLPESVPLDRILCNKIEIFLNLNFTSIARNLVRDHSSSPTTTLNETHPSIKFIYFNRHNFAEKFSPGYQCDLDSYRLLADLHHDLTDVQENGEIITKMQSDNWVAGKVSNQREFYAIFNHKNSNVLEIDEEMTKLAETHLSNIFFQD